MRSFVFWEDRDYAEIIEQVPGASGRSVIYGFDNGFAGSILGGLILDGSGNLYGTTEAGGFNGFGTVFELSPKMGVWPPDGDADRRSAEARLWPVIRPEVRHAEYSLSGFRERISSAACQSEILNPFGGSGCSTARSYRMLRHALSLEADL